MSETPLFAEYGGCVCCITSDDGIVNMANKLNSMEVKFPMGKEFKCHLGYFQFPSNILEIKICDDHIEAECEDGYYHLTILDGKHFIKKIDKLEYQSMGEKATCPVCGSYSSNVWYDINNGNDCRSCGCPNELLAKHQDFLSEIQVLKNKKINSELIDRLEELQKENDILKSKIKKLTDILGYEFDSTIINSLKECIRIIQND